MSGELESITGTDGPIEITLAVIETMLALGIAYRAVVHLMVYNAARGAGAGNEHTVAGIESRFAVCDGVDPVPFDVDFFARACTMVFGVACYLAFAGWVTGGGHVLRTIAAANWLVLVGDPAVGLYSQFRQMIQG